MKKVIIYRLLSIIQMRVNQFLKIKRMIRNEKWSIVELKKDKILL